MTGTTGTAAVAGTGAQQAGPHLVPLGGSGWHVWRDAVLRSAGFPARAVLALADAGLAAAADRAVATAGHPARAAYDDEYAAATGRLSAAIRGVAGDTRFREAVTWQNRRLLGECLDKAAAGEPRNVRGRNHELTIASYLQRYCLKNDTIGFFGPVGWARWGEEGPALTVTVGDRLLARRTVYFETWTVDAVARALGEDPLLRPWLVPRLVAAHRLDGPVVHTARGVPVALSGAQAELLSLCDGRRSVREIAAELAWSEFSELGDEDECHAHLAELCRLGIVHLDLTGPIEAWPERTLRRRLEPVTDQAARERALTALGDIESARDAVAAAAGDPAHLAAAIDVLSTRFSKLTGVAGERRHGETYAGRTLVYEDAVRDVRVRLGAPLREALAPALGLLLDSARWLVAAAGAEYQRLFLELYEQRRAGSGDPAVPLAGILSLATPYLYFSLRELPRPVAAVLPEFQRRWAEVLDVPAGARRHTVRAAEIRDRVAGAFPATAPPWATATQHAPDVMLAAADVAAVGRGEFLAVLGELHTAFNTLESRVFVEQHDQPGWLLAAAAADLGARRVYAIPPKEWPAVTSRLAPPSALLAPEYTYWTLHSDSVGAPGPVLPAADLFVHRAGDRLLVRARRGGFEADLLEVVGEFLSAAVVNGFKPLPPAPRRPRVAIDKLVVARAAWTFAATDVRWAFTRSEADRFLAARAWRAANELPERGFYHVPVEDKPAFVDFRSLVFVNLFAKAVRRTAERPAGTVSVTEMLPDLDQTWLTDAQGEGYTCELRILAVDPLSHRA
ncbi:MAG TPA: lantibiotic dehydratase [Micromonosporaceae bacterium]|nr:lantibiotic dehydratase [Micromonosporaceae bacterium]